MIRRFVYGWILENGPINIPAVTLINRLEDIYETNSEVSLTVLLAHTFNLTIDQVKRICALSLIDN